MNIDAPALPSHAADRKTRASRPGESRKNMRDSAAAPPVPHTLSQALNDKIRELLVEEGWSQRELGKRLGMTQGAVSYLLALKRRAAVLDYYERIARDLFEMSLSTLIADLEARVAGGRTPLSQGAVHAHPSTPAERSLPGGEAVIRILVEAFIAAHHTALGADVRAALAEYNQIIHAPPARPRKRRPAAERADDDSTALRGRHPDREDVEPPPGRRLSPARHDRNAG